MDKIKGIFFDLGWTLCYPASGNWMLTNKCVELIGGEILNSIPRKRLENALSAGMKYLDDNHLILTEQEEFKQFQQFYAMITYSLPETSLTEKQIREIAYDKVYNMSNYIFYDDVFPNLERLSKTYKLGIISDTWPSAAQELKSAGIYDYFQAFTFSCNLGVFKPHPKMYENAIANMKLPSKETLFIDDFFENLEGARRYGINPVMISRSNNPNAGKQGSCRTIQSLMELL